MKTCDIGYETTRCISKATPDRQKDQKKPEPDFRLEKIRSLREEIEKGAYQIDYDKIAENMIGLFRNEIGSFTASWGVIYH